MEIIASDIRVFNGSQWLSVDNGKHRIHDGLNWTVLKPSNFKLSLGGNDFAALPYANPNIPVFYLTSQAHSLNLTVVANVNYSIFVSYTSGGTGWISVQSNGYAGSTSIPINVSGAGDFSRMPTIFFKYATKDIGAVAILQEVGGLIPK
jgi:hypothetical protein